jgi:peptide/nickel transport system permease protein
MRLRFVLLMLSIIVVGVVASATLPNPNVQDLLLRHEPPVFQAGGAWAHPLGTDHLGRDILSRLVAGTGLTLIIAITAVAIGLSVGVLLGMVGGVKRGWFDHLICRVTDAQLAVPVILMAMAVITVRGRSVPVLIGVLALLSWPFYVRVIRAESLAIAARPFVLGLRAAGVPDWRIVLFHVLPNLAPTVIALGTLQVGSLILAESALSFIGVGVVSPDISWGAMLAEGRTHITEAWWPVTFPGIAITLVVLCTSLGGDMLRSRYDVRKRTYWT